MIEFLSQCRRRLWMWTCVVAIAGCNAAKTDDENSYVEALASQWPPYRAPALSDPATVLRQEFGLSPAASPAWERPDRVTVLPPVQPAQAWPIAETAMDSLGRIGAPAVPALVHSLRHPDPERRARAARVLARIGPSAQSAVPALVASLNDPELSVQKAAARALGQIGPAARQAVEPLVELMAEPAAARDSQVLPASYSEPEAPRKRFSEPPVGEPAGR